MSILFWFGKDSCSLSLTFLQCVGWSCYEKMWEDKLKGNLACKPQREGAQSNTGHLPSISIVQPNAMDLPLTAPKFQLNWHQWEELLQLERSYTWQKKIALAISCYPGSEGEEQWKDSCLLSNSFFFWNQGVGFSFFAGWGGREKHSS